MECETVAVPRPAATQMGEQINDSSATIVILFLFSYHARCCCVVCVFEIYMLLEEPSAC
jgi:hypothetical protein